MNVLRLIRLPLLRLLRATLRLRARRLEAVSGRLLVIAPHPDDETLGCGGLIMDHRRKNLPVGILYLTDGSASHRRHPLLAAPALAELRAREALAAAAALGVDTGELLFLNLPDGELSQLPSGMHADAVARIAASIDKQAPALVLAAYRHDGSSEHEAAFTLVTAALARCSTRPRLMEYPVWSAYSPRLLLRTLVGPGCIYKLALGGLRLEKMRAIDAYQSQFSPTPPWSAPVQPDGFRNALSHDHEFFIELSP